MDVDKGHEIGVDTLEKVLDWTIELGIEIVNSICILNRKL